MAIARDNYVVPAEIEAVIANFSAITDVPRPSGDEEAIRQHLIEKAADLGLETKVDARGNLAMDVPASVGCEDWQRVILQGHIDMVTTGGNDVAPTNAYIENGWIKAKETTLGADNGIAIAMAFALAADADLKHGPMTILATVHEETAPMGAMQLDPEIVPAVDSALVINLDAEEGAEMICRGCAASSDITAEFELGELEVLIEGTVLLRLDLHGLVGGHSGCNIHDGRGNAIKLMNELLVRLRDVCDFSLMDFQGGERRNVIPSKANCTIAVARASEEDVKSLVKDFQLELRRDGLGKELLSEYSGELTVDVAVLEEKDGVQVLSDDLRDVLIAAIRDMVNGPIERVESEWGGGVRLSNNLAILEHEDGVFKLLMMARGAEGDKLQAKIEEIEAGLLEAGAIRVESGEAVGDWLEPDDSKAVDLAVAACKKVLGVEPTVFAYHAGLECPHVLDRLSGRIKNISAVAIGPVIRDAHSVHERVSIKSIADVYAYLKYLISMVGQDC
jgi:dipeptidase D